MTEADATEEMIRALDPRGLMREAYAIEGIVGPQCCSIYLDWALGLSATQDATKATAALLAHYGPAWPDHPMTAVLREGLSGAATPMGRRGGAQGRKAGKR